jgi:hypothetical protein
MSRPACQKCSTDLKYIQRMYEYHCVYEADENNVDLSVIDDSVMDEEYEPHLYCETCDEPRTHDGLPRPKKKFNVVIAVLFSEPQSYELEEVVIEAYNEDEAMDLGESEIEERIEKSEGNSHNIAGFHKWLVNEREEEEDDA